MARKFVPLLFSSTPGLMALPGSVFADLGLGCSQAIVFGGISPALPESGSDT
jgi:hypothetical protein